MNHNWLDKNTFHYSDFKDLSRLVEEKQKKNLKISLCLPTLNEEKTIAKEIIIMKSELMTRYPLVDEIVVIDSGSTDNTVDIAKSFGADVHDAPVTHIVVAVVARFLKWKSGLVHTKLEQSRFREFISGLFSEVLLMVMIM